jgi:hypothetical protein
MLRSSNLLTFPFKFTTIKRELNQIGKHCPTLIWTLAKLKILYCLLGSNGARAASIFLPGAGAS